MSFLVVKTIEDGKIFLTSVPNSWCDENILYFPNSDWKNLRKRKTPPEIDWKRFNCEVKGKFKTLEEALQAEKRLVGFEDTEDEERYYNNLMEKRAHPARSLSVNQQENNYNERMAQIECSSNNLEPVYERDFNLEESSLSPNFNMEQSVTVMDLPNVVTTIEELKEDVLKLNAKVDKILSILMKKVTVVSNSSLITSSDCANLIQEESMFPIKSVEDLNSLNEKLNDNSTFQSTLNRFKNEFIGVGHSWKKICYMLIDKLIDRHVLTSYTWTGSSKKQNKYSFSALVNFNKLFYCIVKAGDQTYNQVNHEDFFKYSILKYSDARATTAVNGLKRISAPRVCVRRNKPVIDLSCEPIVTEQENELNVHCKQST